MLKDWTFQKTSVSSLVVCVTVMRLLSHSVEEVCGKIYDELRSDIISGSGLYIQYLEAEEEEDK